jgi:NADPH:quinone reductase-like Zn-dependent oxidoreductase
LGSDKVIDRDFDIVAALGECSIDVVVDLVAGPHLLNVLKRGGRYVTAGTIAVPKVELDVRTLYLKDLSLSQGSIFILEVLFRIPLSSKRSLLISKKVVSMHRAYQD